MDRKIFTRLIIIHIKKKEIKILIHPDFFQNNLSIEIENTTCQGYLFNFIPILTPFIASFPSSPPPDQDAPDQ